MASVYFECSTGFLSTIHVYLHAFLVCTCVFSMYCVIQFDDSGSNSLAVVHETWLTPLKKEVFWPPFKDSKYYKRALSEGAAIDAENWKLFGVNRIFYQTDELEKAFKKEKEAEVTSDLADTDIDLNAQTIRQPRKTCRRVLESSESEEESRYSRPPKIKIKKLSGAIETKYLQNSGLKSVSIVQQSSCRKLALIPVQQSSGQNQPTQIQHSDGEFSQPSSSFCSPSPINNSFAESAIKTLVSIVNQVKEQNKLIIGKLDEVQNTLLNKQGAQDVKDSFPEQLPLKNIEGLNIFEEHTKEKEKFNLLVTHLGSLGGKSIKLRIHKALRELLTDDLASYFSYYGKRSKEPFYELNINKALLRAVVQSENTTISDVEDIIKLWIKHAPDRLKARNKTDASKGI